MRSAAHLAGASIGLLLLLLLTAPIGQAGDVVRARYSYDDAGRLVEVRHDRPGRPEHRAYTYDAAGNLTAIRTSLGRDFVVVAQKPRKGVWVVSLWDDGPVSGYGADTDGALFDVAGSLTLADRSASGSIEVAGSSEKFVFDGAKVKRDRSGAPTALTLKTPKGATPLLRARAKALPALPVAFEGTYGGAKNSVKVGKEASPLGVVEFKPIRHRPGACALSGAVTGTLLRGTGTKAYGTVTFDGVEYPVTAVLKDGARTVRAKSTGGTKLRIKLSR